MSQSSRPVVFFFSAVTAFSSSMTSSIGEFVKIGDALIVRMSASQQRAYEDIKDAVHEHFIATLELVEEIHIKLINPPMKCLEDYGKSDQKEPPSDRSSLSSTTLSPTSLSSTVLSPTSVLSSPLSTTSSTSSTLSATTPQSSPPSHSSLTHVSSDQDTSSVPNLLNPTLQLFVSKVDKLLDENSNVLNQMKEFKLSLMRTLESTDVAEQQRLNNSFGYMGIALTGAVASMGLFFGVSQLATAVMVTPSASVTVSSFLNALRHAKQNQHLFDFETIIKLITAIRHKLTDMGADLRLTKVHLSVGNDSGEVRQYMNNIRELCRTGMDVLKGMSLPSITNLDQYIESLQTASLMDSFSADDDEDEDGFVNVALASTQNPL